MSTSPAAEKLFVSELFLQNPGGGSSFIGHDDFQNTLSALEAWQSRTLMAHHVLKLHSLKQSPYGLTAEPSALRADTRLRYQLEMSCVHVEPQTVTCKPSSEVSNVVFLIKHSRLHVLVTVNKKLQPVEVQVTLLPGATNQATVSSKMLFSATCENNQMFQVFSAVSEKKKRRRNMWYFWFHSKRCL